MDTGSPARRRLQAAPLAASPAPTWAERREPGAFSEAPLHRLTGFSEPGREPPPRPPAGAANRPGDPVSAAEALVGLPLAEIDRLVIEATIRACGGSLPKAAQVLEVSPSTLYRKRDAWGE